MLIDIRNFKIYNIFIKFKFGGDFLDSFAVNENLKKLKIKANNLPLQAGVYIMKNNKGEIIYIGKAKALKNRVTQYFGAGNNHTEKVRQMVLNVEDFEYIVCDSEFEALILENSLIKQNQPKYNILLKDDKGYSYIKITNEKWPRIKSSKILDDSGEFIGPYNSGFIVKETVDEVRKIFKLPDCNRNFDIYSKPCLNYYINICDAPCKKNISLNEYLENISAAKQLIKKGSYDADYIAVLENKMNEAAEKFEFEIAAKYRDRIRAIKKIKEKQKVVSISYQSQDVISTATIGEISCVTVFEFRNYKLSNKSNYIFDGYSEKNAVYKEFLQQYYLEKNDIPSRILIDTPEDFSIIEEWLSKKTNHKVKFIQPKQGEILKILNMCFQNSAQVLSEKTQRTGKEMGAINELATLLGLSTPPRYIEAYDISNTSGSENVAGMIVFKEARPFKNAYRHFKIKSFVGQDDYRSMAEVLDRRFNEYEKQEDAAFSKLPDLILLDGSTGQINAVLDVMNKYNINIPIFGMVKDSKHRTRAIATTGGDIAIKSNRACFTLITNIQDEVHRFAIKYHKTLHSKNALDTELTKISGIGKAKAQFLIKHFKSINNIKKATVDELCGVKGISKINAKNIFGYFNENS